MIEFVNQVFKEHFGPVKLTGSMAAEIVANQERLGEERAGRRCKEEDKGEWAGATDKFINRRQDDKEAI